MADIQRRRINWRAVLEDIKAIVGSLYKIAQRLGFHESTVQSYYHQGVEPSHSRGEALLELHTEVCGADKTKSRCTEESVYSETR